MASYVGGSSEWHNCGVPGEAATSFNVSPSGHTTIEKGVYV